MSGRGRRRSGEALCDDDLTYEQDYVARVFVRMHPNGATLEEVALMHGVTRERIRQIEARALKKLAIYCAREGIELADLLASPAYTREEESRTWLM